MCDVTICNATRRGREQSANERERKSERESEFMRGERNSVQFNYWGEIYYCARVDYVQHVRSISAYDVLIVFVLMSSGKRYTLMNFGGNE